MHPLNDRVAALIAAVGARVVLPRFRNLAAADIVEKSRGEVVTIADREAEALLAEGLAAIDPTARVVGEEAAAADPGLLDGLGRGRVWIVDPVDGTSNFAAGRTPFGMIVALVEDGVVAGGWLHDPVTGRMCHAVAGGGAFIDGVRVTATPVAGRRPVATLGTRFMTDAVAARVATDAAAAFDLQPIPLCAAEHYPRLVLGQYDVALFQRTLPWDHAAGALFLTEAGGRVTRWDGSPYRIDDDAVGIVAAVTAAAWTLAMDTLRPGAADFLQAERRSA